MVAETVPLRWQCSDGESAALARALGEGFRLETGDRECLEVHLYDSLHRSFITHQQALVRIGERFRVVSAVDLSSETVESPDLIAHQQPVCWWDFQPGAFQQLLRNRLKLRAAVQLASIRLVVNHYRVRNRHGMVLLGLAQRIAKIGEDRKIISWLASPHEGHQKEAEALATRISQVPDFKAEQDSLARRVLIQLGRENTPLTPKEVIQLQPTQTVQHAISTIASVLIQVAREREQGIIDDIDTEFLHDYRVSLRKLRSVLSLVKGAYLKQETREIRGRLREYARATNHLRDLDVCLLREADYRGQVPADLRSGLDRLFVDLATERRRLADNAGSRLQTVEYLDRIQQIQQWFRRPDLPPGPKAGHEIRPVVVKQIARRYKLIRKKGRELNPNTPDQAFHDLRIECKKLRYLLELFGSLFSSPEMKRILRRLRGLQDVLGQFNDHAVQMGRMTDYLNGTHNLDPHSASSISSLISSLQLKQCNARAAIAERFLDFGDIKMKRRFTSLLVGQAAPSK